MIDLFAELGPTCDAGSTPSVTGSCMGGSEFAAPTPIDDEVVATIEALCRSRRCTTRPTSPASRVARQLLPDVPHVAVFDTAFHHDLPAAAHLRHRPARWPPPTASAATASTARRTPSSPPAAAELLGRPVGDLARSCCTSATAPRRRPSPAGGGRHLDGLVAARGLGDGHPLGRRRPGGGVPPAPHRPPVRRRDRRPAQPPVRDDGPRRPQRHARGAPPASPPATPTPPWPSRCTCIACASTSAPTPPSSAASTPSCSPPASASTTRWYGPQVAGLGFLGLAVDPAPQRGGAAGPG